MSDASLRNVNDCYLQWCLNKSRYIIFPTRNNYFAPTYNKLEKYMQSNKLNLFLMICSYLRHKMTYFKECKHYKMRKKLNLNDYNVWCVQLTKDAHVDNIKALF